MVTAMTLQDEFDYFVKNQKELVKQYEGKYLIIHSQEVVGAYETEIEAYKEAQEKFELKPGTFLIQPCVPGEESYSQTFYSRVGF